MAGARTQIVAAVVLAAATYGVLLRIAEAKVETSVGGGGFPLEDTRPDELAAFQRLRASLAEIGEPALADRLERLRQDGAIWVAPSMGPDRWAVFVESLRLVRRIYVRRQALLDPGPTSSPTLPPGSPTPTSARSPGSAWPARCATSWRTMTA